MPLQVHLPQLGWEVGLQLLLRVLISFLLQHREELLDILVLLLVPAIDLFQLLQCQVFVEVTLGLDTIRVYILALARLIRHNKFYNGPKDVDADPSTDVDNEAEEK